MVAKELKRQGWRRSVVSLALMVLLLFGPAGTLRYWQAWLFALVFVASSIAIGLYFSRYDPKLLARRMKAGPGAETEPSQKIIIFLIILGFSLLLAFPSFDHRSHWSDVPVWVVLAANAGVVLSFVIFFVVLKQNSYAASTVTVEAGQPVISTGVYAIVRHPMYAGALQLLFCMPLALGSSWGLLVALATVPLLMWRLLDEERVLRRDLAGYVDYCRHVRFRLIPGIW